MNLTNPQFCSLFPKWVQLLAAAFAGLAPFVASAADGAVNFSNIAISGGVRVVDAPVFDADGTTLLAGGDFRAQLYAGPFATELEPSGLPGGFLDGPGAGYFVLGTRAIPRVVAGEVAFVQIRVWAAAAGITYEVAASVGGSIGASEIFAVRTGNSGFPPSLPANLTALRGFRLEPPLIIEGPVGRVVFAGETARFNIGLSRQSGVVFQWQKDG